MGFQRPWKSSRHSHQNLFSSSLTHHSGASGSECRTHTARRSQRVGGPVRPPQPPHEACPGLCPCVPHPTPDPHPFGAHPGLAPPRRTAVSVAEAGQPEAARLRGAAVHADGALPAPARGPRALHTPHSAADESRSRRGPPDPAAAPAPSCRRPGFRSGARHAGTHGRSPAPHGSRPRPFRRQAGPWGPRPPPEAAGPGPRGPEGTDSPCGGQQDGWSGSAPPAPTG